MLENWDLSPDIRQRTIGCLALLDTFPSVVSRSTVLLSDRYAILCSASDRNFMIWLKKFPHCKQEIEHNQQHVTIRAGTTSLYLIRWSPEHDISFERGSNLSSEAGDPYDGATHTSPFLREVLNELLPARWNGRCSPKSPAPLRRPSLITDLTASDNFLWGSLLV